MKTSDNETSLNISFHFHLPQILILPPQKKSPKNVTLWLFRRQPGRGKGEDKRGEGKAGRREEIEREREVKYVRIIYN